MTLVAARGASQGADAAALVILDHFEDARLLEPECRAGGFDEPAAFARLCRRGRDAAAPIAPFGHLVVAERVALTT
jgi:hypothetical protein